LAMAHWTIAFFYVHGWTVCRGRMDAQERRMSMDGGRMSSMIRS